ncbi:hypothetical protein BGZ93_000234 [Podila epicladia]|nr:hypothetical protein BGZ93_000234 [Podila epicladia]
MSSQLSRRRKQELRDIAKNLGLTDDGTREDIYDRIKEFVAAHPNDTALREILGEDAGSDGPSANASRRSSLSTTTITHSTRSSPTKKTAAETRATRSSGESGRNSSEATHGLKEHQVHGFMNHMQSELHDAKGLAKKLQETLHGKLSSGSSKTGSSSSARRGSQSQHPLDQGSSSSGRRSSKDHGDEHNEASSSSLRRRRRRSYEHADGEDEGLLGKVREWGQHWAGEVKHRFVECKGSCDFATCATKPWKLVHDLGSTSTGFVWLTLLLELGVFLSQAHSHFEAGNKGHHDGWFHCLSFFTNWADFLHPFFSYYGTLFVIPTLLSQLFNVDRSRVSRSHDSSSSEHLHSTHRTGLLSGRKFTTSGLSYFAFKFALTYFLGQSQGLGSLMGHLAGGGLWSGCKYISQVFRYVPQSLGLATSGVGTVLALAEIIVASGRRR